MNYKNIIGALFLLLLIACSDEMKLKLSGGEEKNIAAPDFPKIATPAELITDEIIQENMQKMQSQIIKTDGKTTYYFTTVKDKNGNTLYPLVDKKEYNAHFHRVILGRTIHHDCIVQGFLTLRNNAKQTEPFWVRKENCDIGNVFHPDDGWDIEYTRHGKIYWVANRENGDKRFFYFQSEDDKYLLKVDWSNPFEMTQTTIIVPEKGQDYARICKWRKLNDELKIKKAVRFLYNGRISEYSFEQGELSEHLIWLSPKSSPNKAISFRKNLQKQQRKVENYCKYADYHQKLDNYPGVFRWSPDKK